MMINPPKPPEGPKPTKAMFTSQFEHKPTEPLPLSSPPPPAAPLPLPPPPPSCSSSLQAVASSQDPLLSSASAQPEA